ncbi:DNA primase [Oleidesulfovibrio sp.]|uniref:DNA primase n=1 Tax=Oleidesulfovibrio sp. TaxID=2909707 RepID=UPI003A8A5275
MSGHDNSAVQAIKARLNLAELARRYVELRRIGNRWMAPCPFHQETKPSFSINEEEGFYYCFGCQASGDLIDFYCRINGLEFREGLEQLAEEAGVTLGQRQVNPYEEQERKFRTQCFDMYAIATQHFSRNLRDASGKECRDYIQGRTMSPEIVKSFELGWSKREWSALADELQRAGYQPRAAAKAGLLSTNDSGRMYDRFRGRLIFPIKNLSGKVIAFGGRIISSEDQAKYINSSDSTIYKKGDHLYGLYQARRAISQHKRALLTEGYMDVLALHQFGYANACGVLGTALTESQVKRLSGFCSHVDLIFDGDGPGRKAALRSCEMMLVKGMNCRVVLMPEGEDIDSLLHKQGTQAFDELSDQAPDGLDYCIKTLQTTFSPREILDWTTAFLNQLERPELASFYVSRLAGGLGLQEAELRAGLKMAGGKAAPQARSSAAGRVGKERKLERHLMEFAVRFPRHLTDLQARGAEEVLVSRWAKDMWDKLLEFGEGDAPNHFSEEQKSFWIRCRVADPIPAENERQELEDLYSKLAELNQKEQSRMMLAALRQLSKDANSDAGFELLRAMKDNLGRSDG